MRLLVINQFASTPKYSTGAGERFYYLGKYFRERKISIEVISAGFNHLFKVCPSTPNLFNKEVFNHSEFIWLKVRKYSARSSLFRVLSQLEFLFKLFLYPIKRVGKPDVVLVSSMSIFPIYYAIYLKKRFKIPFILEIRDIWPETAVELGGYSPSHPFIKLLKCTANLGYRQADHIVSVLPDFNKYLEQVEGHCKAVSWIPNGVEMELETRGEIVQRENNIFVVGYAGAIGQANALEYLVDAAILLERENLDIRFEIIGDGPQKEDLIRRSKKASNIKFFPKVLKEDVLQIINERFDVCFIGWRDKHIYKYGVSANKYNDYMLTRKPILSSSNIEKDPVLLTGCGVTVPAENPNDIAVGIMKLKEATSTQLKKMGDAGYDYVKSQQSYFQLSEKYIDVLRSVIKTR